MNNKISELKDIKKGIYMMKRLAKGYEVKPKQISKPKLVSELIKIKKIENPYSDEMKWEFNGIDQA
jgi:hypothetical protein